MSVLTKLEIDVLQFSELSEAASLAAKYNLPALVIHPGLATQGLIARGRVRGKYKIITPVDWPKGDNFGKKMQGLSLDALDTDGFEVLLTPNMSTAETANETRSITDLIRRHLSELAEVRFVLGYQLNDDIDKLLEGLKRIPNPTMVRNDITLKTQVGKANPEIHNQTINHIRQYLRVPLKIAGNINNIKAMASCEGVAKFGVSLTQAKAIIKEFVNNPEPLKDILN